MIVLLSMTSKIQTEPAGVDDDRDSTDNNDNIKQE